MQENFKLLKSVLEKLHKTGCLEQMILVGSWASHLYQLYYDSKEYRPLIRTSDVDFLIPNPRQIKGAQIDIGEILGEIGFVKSFNRSNGVISYEREGLTIEFLTPEVGKGGHEPISVKNLNVNAQQLRFMTMLTEDPLTIKYGLSKVKVPDPIAYAFHKLLISERRTQKEKQAKDYQSALELLQFLQSKGMQRNIMAYYHCLRPGWRKKIISILKQQGDSQILSGEK